MVIKSLWLTTATRIKGSVERKTCALAGIRFLTEAPAFLNQPLVVLWFVFSSLLANFFHTFGGQ